MVFVAENTTQMLVVFCSLCCCGILPACAEWKLSFVFYPLLTTVACVGLQVRNNYRHYFLSSGALKAVYDAGTWAVTQLAVSYTVAPFVMLAVEPTISLYR